MVKSTTFFGFMSGVVITLCGFLLYGTISEGDIKNDSVIEESSSSGSARLDAVEKRVQSWLSDQKYFTAIKGGDFRDFKKAIKENGHAVSIAIIEQIHKEFNLFDILLSLF